jgi:hypothetical protein
LVRAEGQARPQGSGKRNPTIPAPGNADTAVCNSAQ